MRFRSFAFLGCLVACASRLTSAPPEPETLRKQVADTERAFAETMARRDLAAFTAFLSEEAVFLSSKGPLRGKAEVAAWWKRFFETREAPFSWRPESVEVAASGTLALSTGPVHDAAGKRIGTFTSVWRLEGEGTWRILFDKGDPACGNP